MSKTQLYNQLETAIDGYNKFFQNAINTRDEVFYQLRGNEPKNQPVLI